MSLINIQNLTFSYDNSDKKIFDNVSFQIDTDWKIGLVGRNGRGKTTFLNLLLGKYKYKGIISKNVENCNLKLFFVKEIRKKSSIPIIIVTSRDSEIDELLCINYGADHYITKPFNIQILLAKISSILRRTSNQEKMNRIDAKDFILNTSNSTIEKNNKIIELTKNEYKILMYLTQNRGKIVSREDIMECLWESESFIDDNTLTVNITRLRNKLDEIGKKSLITEVAKFTRVADANDTIIKTFLFFTVFSPFSFLISSWCWTSS